MPFFNFRQNNSGGSFVIDPDRGIGPQVWVEADDSEHANYRARRLGIYFDGVAGGTDCSCCGDRWSEVWRDEREESPKIEAEWDYNWHDTVYIHHADGTIEHVKGIKKE